MWCAVFPWGFGFFVYLFLKTMTQIFQQNTVAKVWEALGGEGVTCHTGPCAKASVHWSLSSSSPGEPDQGLLPGASSHRLQELWQREELHPLPSKLVKWTKGSQVSSRQVRQWNCACLAPYKGRLKIEMKNFCGAGRPFLRAVSVCCIKAFKERSCPALPPLGGQPCPALLHTYS